MTEWVDKPLGEVMTLQRGFDLPARLREDGPIPIISSSGASGFHSYAKVKAPGVVTGRYGTIGRVFYVCEDFWPLNTTLWVKDFKGADPRFAYYLLQSIDFESCNDKSGVPGVNRNDLHRLDVLLPPLSEQRAIASVLGALDDKIELNRRMNRTLEEMAAALFKSWFVDRASPSGSDQESWPEVELKSQTDLLAGFAFKSKDFTDGSVGTRLLRGTNVAPGSTNWSQVAGWPGNISGGYEKYLLEVGDIVLAMDRPWIPAGTKMLMISRIDLPCLLVQRVARMRSKANLTQTYLWLLLSRQEFTDYILRVQTGTGVPHISAKNILSYRLRLPPDQLLDKFEDAAGPLLRMSVRNREESRTLADLRDTLLPKLLSGEIRLKQAEKAVEGVV